MSSKKVLYLDPDEHVGSETWPGALASCVEGRLRSVLNQSKGLGWLNRSLNGRT